MKKLCWKGTGNFILTIFSLQVTHKSVSGTEKNLFYYRIFYLTYSCRVEVPIVFINTQR